MWLHNDNMNFQLKHLMRERLCVQNTITWECFCWEKTPVRAPELTLLLSLSVSLSPMVQSNALFSKYSPSRYSQSCDSSQISLKGGRA